MSKPVTIEVRCKSCGRCSPNLIEAVDYTDTLERYGWLAGFCPECLEARGRPLLYQLIPTTKRPMD